MQIPDKLLAFEGFDDGNRMIGVADVTLPNISFMTETIKGAGVAGEIDLPVMGLTGSMTTTINWRTLVDTSVRFAAPKVYTLDFRGAVQGLDPGAGEYTTYIVGAKMQVVPKSITLGNLDVGATMGTSAEYEVLYLKISINERDFVEIDKRAYIYRIDGTDYLQNVRNALLG